MRTIFTSLAGAALLASGAAEAEGPSPQERLDKVLGGRVAGEPVSCINLARSRSTQVIPGEAIVYKVGDTLYVNRPRSGAESLSQWDILFTRNPTTRLCSTDSVQLRDRYSQAQTGIVFLGEFVPYRRAGRSD